MREGVPDTGKKCRTCGEVKALESFHNLKKSKDGKQSQCKACQKARLSTPDNAKKRKDLAWRSSLKRFNLTEDDYEAMFQRQLGLCAICHKPDTSGTRLAVDHDHSCCDGNFSCGKCVRSLLCKRCNMAIGLLGDDPDVIMSAALYVRSAANS